MTKKINVVIKATNETVTLVSVSGGWTTIKYPDGIEKKLRNSCIQELPHNPLNKPEIPTIDDGIPTIDNETSKSIKMVNPDLSHYVKHEIKTASGRASFDIDDEAASILRGEDVSDCYFVVAKHIAKQESRDVDRVEAELKNKYGHLNVGMQRMNLGNRLRKLMGTYGNINKRKTEAIPESETDKQTSAKIDPPVVKHKRRRVTDWTRVTDKT